MPVLGVASQCKAIRNRLRITIYTRIGKLSELRLVMPGLPPIHPAAAETICQFAPFWAETSSGAVADGALNMVVTPENPAPELCTHLPERAGADALDCRGSSPYPKLIAVGVPLWDTLPPPAGVAYVGTPDVGMVGVKPALSPLLVRRPSTDTARIKQAALRIQLMEVGWSQT